MKHSYLLLFGLFATVSVAQLKSFGVIEMENPGTRVVQASNDYPDNAIIFVYSVLEDLTFRSSIGGVNQQRFNRGANRYEILISPQRQIIFVQGKGFREERIGVLNPSPKEDFYFEVEEKMDRETARSIEPGILDIRSKPTGANIYFNDIQLADKTPKKISFNPGAKHIKLAYDGYLTLDTIVFLVSGQTMVLDVQLEIDKQGALYLEQQAAASETGAWRLAQQQDDIAGYNRYLSRYPSGMYVREANERLAYFYMQSGDKYLAEHNYSAAGTSYENARKYVNNDVIDKRFKKLNRWSRSGINTILFHLDAPLGFNATSMMTRDYYEYMHHLQGGSVPQIGIGHQKQEKLSVITPLTAKLEYNKPVRFNNVRPFAVTISAFYSTLQTTHLDRVTPDDYEIYSDVYPINGEPILGTDTMNFGLYTNAYRFKRWGVNIGFKPFPFLHVYVPVQHVSVLYQPGFICLDCRDDQIEMGRFSYGIGLEVEHVFDNGIGLLGFWENWNAIFNGNDLNNDLYTEGNPSSGVFSPSAFSRTIGAEIRFPAGENAFSIRYENPLVRGDFFSAEVNNMQSVRSFSMHLVQFRFTVRLH
jgi:hypothetical protein